MSQNIKNTLLPIDIFSIKNRNFVLVNLLVNKDIIFPKTMGFKSHLYGIEIHSLRQTSILGIMFKSHLYGIEIRCGLQRGQEKYRLNRTFMELKLKIKRKWKLSAKV